MSRQRYPEEFKIEAVKQVTKKGKPVADVAQRLGMAEPQSARAKEDQRLLGLIKQAWLDSGVRGKCARH